ncbi:MAG: helicase-related protein [Candidatus Bathycorpusculaceae bacterium]
MGGWKDYLVYLDNSPYSLQLLTSSFAPETPIRHVEEAKVEALNYALWPFQQKILDGIGGDTLILGLPTGLGKTYLAGAYLHRESAQNPIRVLFLTPSVPLGVQQTLFARRMLNLKDAFFISGNIPPERRKALRVWNASFAVSTPQTFYNDVLSPFSSSLQEARKVEEPIPVLAQVFKEAGFTFPYGMVVADECQGYVGETDGYSILLSAKACGSRILALSATPQLHAPKRLEELKKIFDRVDVFSVENPEIKSHLPERSVVLVKVYAPDKLLNVYAQIGMVVQAYQRRVRELYGPEHMRTCCKKHGLCVWMLALKMLKFRLVEDGASSVLSYGTWKAKELRRPVKELDGKSIYEAYREAVKERFNHKIFSAMGILRHELYEKAIVFMESVEAARQLGAMLQKSHGMENVAVLVGKGSMTMEQQASALLQFKEQARILVCTSIGEEGLDIPTADIEVWLDPPSNPQKWIQRFGRILRQPGDKKLARTYALITTRTHEKNKLLSVKNKAERVYGFTQRLVVKPQAKALPREQKTITQYLK